jgi:hypothetical protein
VRELVVVVRAEAQHLRRDTEVGVPGHALGAPVLVPAGAVLGGHEELELHLLELARAEDEVGRGDLVPEALAHLGDAERWFLAARLEHIGEVHEHALGRLRPQVHLGAFALDGTGVGLEHEVEGPGLGEAVPGPAVRAHVRVFQMVLPEPALTHAAVHERVGEVGEVA